MKAQKFQQMLETKVAQIEQLLREHLPQKGDTAWDCQLISCLNEVWALRSAISGITDSDLKYDPRSGYPDTRLKRR